MPRCCRTTFVEESLGKEDDFPLIVLCRTYFMCQNEKKHMRDMLLLIKYACFVWLFHIVGKFKQGQRLTYAINS